MRPPIPKLNGKGAIGVTEEWRCSAAYEHYLAVGAHAGTVDDWVQAELELLTAFAQSAWE